MICYAAKTNSYMQTMANTKRENKDALDAGIEQAIAHEPDSAPSHLFL